MNVRRLSCFVIFLAGWVPQCASAQTVDPRMVEMRYEADRVYPIAISPGLASVVEFEADEAIESVVVGDAQNWIVETTASANRVVVKPGVAAGSTNMMVVTTKRTYAFTLDAYGGSDVFVMRFDYAGETVVPLGTYRFRGDRNLVPRLMSDNGRVTTIYWPKDAKFPAIFILDDSGNEVAADLRSAGDGMIVEGVHDRVVFRSGKNKVVARRQASGDDR